MAVASLKIKRGVEANLPSLQEGEPALCTDSLKFYLGTAKGNKRVVMGDELLYYHPLPSPWSHASWDGDAKSDVLTPALLDISTFTGAPSDTSHIRAYAVRMVARDSATFPVDGLYLALGPSSAEWDQALVRPWGGDIWAENDAIVSANEDGDLYYTINASGSLTLDAHIYIWGYFTYDSPCFHPLESPWTHTSWDGDAKSDVLTSTKLDMSTFSGAPSDTSHIRAYLLKLAARDSATAGTDGLYLALGPSSAYWYAAAVRPPGGDLMVYKSLLCPASPEGDLFYRIDASGTGTLDVWIEVWGYMTAGARFHPLDAPWTHTSWDGDAYSDTAATQLDMSTFSGAPSDTSHIRAYLIELIAKDSAAWGTAGLEFSMGPSSSNAYQIVARPPGAVTVSQLGIVNTDLQGDVYYTINASGAGTMQCWIRVWGYFT